MRKFKLGVMFFAFAIVSMISCNANASDYYLGEYENGQVAYLDTTSIRDSETYRNGYLESNNYNCLVKAVYPNSNKFDWISYEVIFSQSVFLRKNGIPCYQYLREIQPYYDTHPVEKNLVEYMSKIEQRKGR